MPEKQTPMLITAVAFAVSANKDLMMFTHLSPFSVSAGVAAGVADAKAAAKEPEIDCLSSQCQEEILGKLEEKVREMNKFGPEWSIAFRAINFIDLPGVEELCKEMKRIGTDQDK